MYRDINNMAIDELKAELKRLQDNLCDIEDMHAFTFGKTSVHMGAEQAQSMTESYEEECREHKKRIAAIEQALKAKGDL